MSAADWALRPQGASVWWFFDPVVGDALRTVGNGDCAALLESEGLERAPHRGVVLVGVATQVVSVLSCEAENRPRDSMPAHCSDAVKHVVISIGMPRAVNLCVGFVRPWSEGENSKRPLIVDHKETVSARGVSLSVDAARIPVGPLSRIPILLHERPGILIRALDEHEVGRGSESNLHVSMIGGVTVHYVSSYKKVASILCRVDVPYLRARV